MACLKEVTMLKRTQKNWCIDATLLTSALLASLSGIYFLFLPRGGYQGGRNPLYNVQILFTRQTWDDLHTWGGVAMIIIALVHLIIHWSWVTNMIRRTFKELTGQCSGMNARGRWNLILNSVVAVSFILTAVSGIYFLFVPGGRGAADPLILFTRATWDLIHTWAGVSLIIAAILHFAIHWKWITKVTRSILGQLVPARAASQPASLANS
jgi:cytochrome b subunit of formate dehydrogenase